MVRPKLLSVLFLLSRLHTPCDASEAVSLADFDDRLISLNLSSQIEIDQFLLDWGFDEKETSSQGGSQDSRQESDPGFSIWRRACPLPGGGDCKPTSLCCSGNNGAWCCAKENPVCCGKQVDAWCCQKDKTCCGHGCCNPGYSCCGTLYGKAKCCGTGRICCNKDTEAGFCCDEDQRCGDSGSCINPSTTVTRTTTIIAAKSAARTVTVTSETEAVRTSTSRTTEVVTVSNQETAISWITSTVTVTDTATGGNVVSSTPAAKRWVDVLATATEEPSVVYLRARASLDPIAHALMARGVPVERRDTITYTNWVTRTADSVSTFTVTSTEWETSYSTTTVVDTATSTTFVSAETTVTSTTTTTLYVKPGETPPPDSDDSEGGGGGGGGSGGNGTNNNSNNSNDGGGGGGGGSNDKAAIIGGSVGGAAGVVFLGLLAFILWKRHDRKKDNPSTPGSGFPAVVETRNSMISPPSTISPVGGAAVMTPPKSPPHSYSPYSQTTTVAPPVGGYAPYPSTNPSPGPMVGQNAYDQSAYNQNVYEIGQTSPRNNISEIYTPPVVHEADTVYPHERGGVAELGPGQAPASPPPGPPGYEYSRQ